MTTEKHSIKRLFAAALAVVTVSFAASALSIPEPAAAHTPQASSTCSTLNVNLTNYGVGAGGALINRVSVTIGGATLQAVDFGRSFAASYPLGNPAVAHSYVVVVDAPGTQYDATFANNSVPCVPPVVNDASAAVSVAPATCDVAGTLVLGAAANVTWGAPSASTGPANYSVVATATAGHAFADGTTTRAFTGTLDGRMDATVAPCAPVVVVPVRPVAIADVTETTGLDCDAMTRSTTTATRTTDWALDVAANTWRAATPVVTTSTATVEVPAAECVTTTVGTTPQMPSLPEIETPPVSPAPSVTAVPATPAAIVPPTTVAAVVPPATVTAVVPTATVPAARTRAAVTATPARTLAATGSDAGSALSFAGALFLVGVALVCAHRLRSTPAIPRASARRPERRPTR